MRRTNLRPLKLVKALLTQDRRATTKLVYTHGFDRTMVFVPLTALAAALALVASGCSTEPATSPPPRERAPAEAGAGQPVTGTAPPAAGGFPSVVILEPRTPGDFPVPTEPALMDQFGRTFFPSLLLAREGQPVRFLNSEDELHNVHVVDTETGSTVLNVAMPILGGSYYHTFERAGTYDVSCNVHPETAAAILVTSTPYAVVADHDGRFSLPDVPPGFYNLTMRHGTRRIERVVEVAPPPRRS